jgi:hypothetical protein
LKYSNNCSNYQIKLLGESGRREDEIKSMQKKGRGVSAWEQKIIIMRNQFKIKWTVEIKMQTNLYLMGILFGK